MEGAFFKPNLNPHVRFDASAILVPNLNYAGSSTIAILRDDAFISDES